VVKKDVQIEFFYGSEAGTSCWKIKKPFYMRSKRLLNMYFLNYPKVTLKTKLLLDHLSRYILATLLGSLK